MVGINAHSFKNLISVKNQRIAKSYTDIWLQGFGQALYESIAWYSLLSLPGKMNDWLVGSVTILSKHLGII